MAAEELSSDKLEVQAKIPRPGDFMAFGFGSLWMMSGAKMLRVNPTDNSVTEIMVAGATGTRIHPMKMVHTVTQEEVATNGVDPTRASRPFDQLRDSGVISEGAGMVILENYETAIGRGVTPYLEITGYGSQGDDYANGELFGLGQTMRAALDSAGKTTEDIDYICAYGPGHPALDIVETDMIKRVFGRRAYNIPISSIKGVTGNALSAAGPHQLITCGLCFKHGIIPPTANYEVPDPRCDLDYVPGRFRNRRINTALINVRGLGGGNSSLIVDRVQE